VSDGLEAVHKAQELEPDLILLDIGLPGINGIEASRRILQFSPECRIIFLSQETSADIAQETLSLGARGYVVKSDATRELASAVIAVLNGGTFVSNRIASLSQLPIAAVDAHDSVSRVNPSVSVLQPNAAITQRHEVCLYSHQGYLMDEITTFVVSALESGGSVIVVATEEHREALLSRLETRNDDVRIAIASGRYITADAGEALAEIVMNGKPDPARFFNLLGDLINTLAKPSNAEHRRVAIFGECVDLLWGEGNAEGAIELERLGNQLAESHDIDILCGYSMDRVQRRLGYSMLQRICAEHSAVHSG